MTDHIVKIQSTWKMHKCKKKVLLFSQLPDDLWNLILMFLNQKDSITNKIDRIIYIRAVKLFYTPPFSHNRKKLHTLALIRKYICYLCHNTIIKCYMFTMRLFKYHTSHTSRLLINATLEHLNNKLC